MDKSDFPKTIKGKEGTSFTYARHWTYRNPDGSPLFYRARYEDDSEKKEIRPFYTDPAGELVMKQPPGKPLPPLKADKLYQNPDKSFLLVEGEKAATCETAQKLEKEMKDESGKNRGYIVTCLPTAPGRCDLTLLKDRKEIYYLPDKDVPGYKKALSVMEYLPRIKVVSPPREWGEKEDIADHSIDDPWDFNAHIETEHLTEEELRELAGEPPKEEEEQPEQKKSQAIRLYEAAKGNVHKFYYSKERDKVYAKIPFRGGTENVPVRSKQFKRFLTKVYKDSFNTTPNRDAINQFLDLIEGEAQDKAEDRNTCVRVGGDDRELKIYLADDPGSVVCVSPRKWEIQESENQKELFLRTTGMKPLPTPKHGGDYTLLKEFIHLESENDWYLLICFICAAFRCEGVYPLLVLIAEQGSGKSTASRMLKALIDPSTVPICSQPQDAKDFYVMADHNQLLIYDNVSSIPQWQSDMLCTLSTGGGYFARQLFTDDEAKIFDQKRPVILNGITDFVNRADLLDRSLLVRLPRIPKEKRKAEKELWEDFNRKLPAIFGGFLDLMAKALKYHPVKADNLPRMADFIQWGMAIEQAAGWKQGTVINAYEENKAGENESILESSPVAMAIKELIDSEGFTGTAGELLNKLNAIDDEVLKKSKSWPSNARKLSGDLRRIAPNLRTDGYNIDFVRKSSGRIITIHKDDGMNDDTPPPQVFENNRHYRHTDTGSGINDDDDGYDGYDGIKQNFGGGVLTAIPTREELEIY